MSKKTLWVLAIVLAVLAAAVWWNGQRAAAPAASAASGRLLPGVDAATVRAVALESAAATTHLAQVDGVWCEEATLYAEDAESGASFGHALAVDGSTLVIGAIGTSSGSAV